MICKFSTVNIPSVDRLKETLSSVLNSRIHPEVCHRLPYNGSLHSLHFPDFQRDDTNPKNTCFFETCVKSLYNCHLNC